MLGGSASGAWALPGNGGEFDLAWSFPGMGPVIESSRRLVVVSAHVRPDRLPRDWTPLSGRPRFLGVTVHVDRAWQDLSTALLVKLSGHRYTVPGCTCQRELIMGPLSRWPQKRGSIGGVQG